MSAALLPTMPAPSPPPSATANEFRKPSKKRGGETPAQTAERHKKRAKAQATEIHYNKGVALKHAEYLRAVMRRIYPEVRRLQMEDNAAYDEGKLQPRRTALDPANVEGGEQLWTLSAKFSMLAVMFLDMVRRRGPKQSCQLQCRSSHGA